MSRSHPGSTAQELAARGQQRVLQLMARGRPLDEVLGELCALVDRHADGAFSCVLGLDPEGRFRFAAGPQVPVALAELLQDPGDGEAFGVAALRAGRPWQSADSGADPAWGDLGPAARRAGLGGWAALPVLGPERQVLGACALGLAEPGQPSEASLGLLRSCAGLASLALQNHQHREALVASERLARSILEASPIGIQVFDAAGRSVAVNPARRRQPEDPGNGRAFNVLEDPAAVASGVADLYRAAYRGEAVERPVVEALDPEGRGRDQYFAQVLYPVKDAGGRVTAVVSMSRDISAQTRAEMALRDEKRRWEALVSNARDLIFTVDRGAEVSYASPSVESLLGHRPAEVVGRPAYDLLHPEDRPRVEAAVAAMVADPDRLLDLEARIRHRDGSWRWMLVRGSNQLANPAVRGVVLNSSDVTVLKAATAALEERERRLRLVLEGAQDAAWDWELASGRVSHDGRWAAITGDPGGSGEHAVQSWAARVHPEDIARVMEVLNDHLRGRSERFQAEYRLLHRDGRWVWVLDRGMVVQRDGSGGPVRLTGTLSDITARKEAELGLQASEERLRAVVAALPDIYLRVDADGLLLDLEGHGEPVLGLAGAVRGQDLRTSPVPQALVEALLAMAGEAIDTGAPRERRLSLSSQEGERFLELRVRRAGPGEALCLLRDITEQHHTEEYLRQSQKLESLGLLAGGIAHDFNNLFQGLMGNLDLARMHAGDSAPALGVLQRMEGIVRRAAELTQRLLDYSGKGFFLVRQTRLSQVLMELAEMLRVPVPAHMALKYDLVPDLPVCDLDPGQLQQVLLNLITNAVEAVGAQAGTVTLATRLEHLSEGPLEGFALEPPGRGPHVVLEVRDDGPGMDEAQRAHCFDPFFSTRFPGRGLGLPAVLGIVRRHQGGIRVRSAPGAGSEFTLYFPVAARPELEGLAPVPALGTLLLADDETVVRQVTADVLRSLGYAVVEAVDGQDALERFQRAPRDFALAILDLVMPRLDGYGAFLALRGIRPDLPVVFISGYSREEVPMPAEIQGHAGFLQKPFQMSQLAQLLDRIRAGKGPV